MATASQNQSTNQISFIPFVVIGVLSAIFGLISAYVLPDLPAPFRILPPQASVESQRIDDLFRILMGLGGFVFFLVQGLIYYAAIAFRAKPNDTSDGPNIHGHMTLEIVWTVIPSLTVIFLGIISYNVWRDNTAPAENPNLVNGESIVINGIGQRFNWGFEYITNNFEYDESGVENPDGNRVIFTVPNLYIYAGQDVEIDLNTLDVIHAFWVPAMRIKQDLLPGRTTHVQFTPRDAGEGWSHVMLAQPTTIYPEESIGAEPLWEVPADDPMGPPRFEFPFAFELVDTSSEITLGDGQDTIWLEVVMPEGGTGFLPVTADTVIGRVNPYRVVCAELCGGGHGDMYTQVVLFETSEAFEMVWYNPFVALNSVPAGSPIEQGIRIIESYGCAGCHQLSFFPNWQGITGPSLTGIADRAATSAVSSGEFMGNPTDNGAEYIVQSLRMSQDYLVSGYPAAMTYFTPDLMPQEDLIGIVSFLCTQTSSGDPMDSSCGLENWEFDENGQFTGDVEALVDELTNISDEYE